MRVGVATVQIPFVRGGAELLAENLVREIRAVGHEAEVVSVPFKWYPARRIPEHMLACRLLDLEESSGTRIDRLIGLKFPAYLIPHSSKVQWLLHQHRGAYDLWDTPFSDLRDKPDGAHIRELIHGADTRLIPEARGVYTISRNVTRRLQDFCGVPSTPLYHPPPDAAGLTALAVDYGDVLLMPSRLNQTKRQGLVLQAMQHTRQPVRVAFMGAADVASHAAALREQSAPLGDRVVWTGPVSDQERMRLYAGCLAVIFPPLDEDYGYVTLEAMLTRKAVVTCTDSGGPLEFVADEETGLVCAPQPQALAAALDRLWADRALARRLGEAGRDRYQQMGVGWDSVLSCLLA